MFYIEKIFPKQHKVPYSNQNQNETKLLTLTSKRKKWVGSISDIGG